LYNHLGFEFAPQSFPDVPDDLQVVVDMGSVDFGMV
jgi:hypothetical protein